MIICRVTGMVVSTIKHCTLTGHKLLICEEGDGASGGSRRIVAVDLVGAGEGDLVLVCRGSAAQKALGDAVPADAAIVGVIDAAGDVHPVGRTGGCDS